MMRIMSTGRNVSPAGTNDRALFSYASFHDTFPQFIAHLIAIAFSWRFRASSSGYSHRWEIERKLTMNCWLTAAMQLQHQSDGDEPGRKAALRQSGTQRFRYQLSQQRCSLNSIGERPQLAQSGR